MKKIISLLVLTAASVAAQDISSELNRELPRWLRFSGEYRSRVEGFSGGGFKRDNSDTYVLSRLRLSLLVQPASWLKMYAQGQDARVFFNDQHPAAPPFQNTWDLRLAYIELGDSEKKAFGLRVGRQELNFGEQRLAGSLNWTNTARSFDAVRATLRGGGFRLDAFASSVVVQQDGTFDHHQQGNNLHGLYGGIEKLVPKAVIEPYVFWRLQHATKLDSKTTGVRWVGKLPGHFDYGTEMAIQRGTLASAATSAWAGHWVGGYTFGPALIAARALVEYNYASGGPRHTFDQLYPTGHDKYGLADQVGWRNIRDLRTGLEFKPYMKWTASAIFHDWHLANPHDSLYNAAGAAIVRAPANNTQTHVGEELDGQAMYGFNKQIQIGLGFGHIFPGAFLKQTTQGRAYNYPYVLANYAF